MGSRTDDPTVPRQVRGRGKMHKSPATGAMLPSVGTVTDKGVPRDAIPGWAARRTAEAAVADPGGLVTAVIADREAAVTALAGAPWRGLEQVGERGRRIHALIRERLDDPTAVPPAVSADEAATAASGLRFLRDFGATDVRTDVTVVNDTVGYAGTIDALAVIGGRTVLADFKSGRAIYPEAAMGAAALAAGEYVTDADGGKHPMPVIDRALGVRIDGDGYSALPLDIGPDTLAAFHAARQTWEYRSVGAKSAVGAPVSPAEFCASDPPDPPQPSASPEDRPFGESPAEPDTAGVGL